MTIIKSILSLIILAFLAFSCEYKSEEKFLKDGVSFTYPSDWIITEQENLNGKGYYLCIEKKGVSESGLITFTWVETAIGSLEYIHRLQQEFRNQELITNLGFTPPKKSRFNKIPSISCDFHFKTLGVSYSGVIYAFTFGQKTFSVIKQDALEDISKNKSGFKLIESTFKIKQK